MKPLHFKLLLATILVAGLTIASTQAQNAPTFFPTANAVETRIGTLKFEQGFPTEETKNRTTKRERNRNDQEVRAKHRVVQRGLRRNHRAPS